MDEQIRCDPGTFVAQHQRGVLRWLRTLGCDTGRAEEHCQDALLAALQHGIDARPPRVARAWLRTTAKNLLRMRLRQEGRRPPFTDASLCEIEDAWLRVRGDDDGGDAALDALRDCLDGAEPRDREVLELRYRQGASRAAMARALDVGEAGVKQALRRARGRMRDCVESKLATEVDGR